MWYWRSMKKEQGVEACQKIRKNSPKQIERKGEEKRGNTFNITLFPVRIWHTGDLLQTIPFFFRQD